MLTPGDVIERDRNPLREIRLVTNDGREFQNTSLTVEAMAINDNPNVTDSDREQQLVALYRQHGRNVTFQGQYRLPTSSTT